jgi:hypothetical protein
MLQTIESILWLVALVVGIWFMVSKKSKIPDQQQSLDPLSGKEKLLVFVLCLFNPLILGAVFYYGWKRKLPQQAKTANLLSFAAFAVFLVVFFGSGYLALKKIGVENVKNINNTVNQAKDLNTQAKAIFDRPDTADTADIQAIKDKIVLGYDKAQQWQPDAKFYSYRRMYTLPSGYSDQLLKIIDSYYFESKNTHDNYELLFDRKSNTVSRVDVNPDRAPVYVERFADSSTIKVGPDKALEMAMLSPTFQKFKSDNPDCVTQVILNEASQPTDLSKYWTVTLYKSLGEPITEANSVQAYVNINTGELISPEAVDALQQINSANNKLK